MTEVFYIIAFVTFVVIFSAGAVAVLWVFWGLINIIAELYIDLRNKWIHIHMAESKLRLYLDHMADFEQYIAAKYPGEVKK